MRPFNVCANMTAGLLLVATSSGGAAEPPARAEAACLKEFIVRTKTAVQQLEVTQMVTAIMQGSRLGPGDGWFKPGQSRYNWDWLAERFDVDRDGRITRNEFTGPPELFDRLDRDRNGFITKSDLDWSEASPYWGQLRQAMQLIRRGGGDGDRKLSRTEWDALFKDLARDKDHIDSEDLRAALFPPEPPRKPGPPSDLPSQAILLQGLLTGELGSASEGPRLGEMGPDFTLTTHDGKKQVTLSQYRGHRPVVLIFGSFT
jgi:hypothetical protein